MIPIIANQIPISEMSPLQMASYYLFVLEGLRKLPNAELSVNTIADVLHSLSSHLLHISTPQTLYIADLDAEDNVIEDTLNRDDALQDIDWYTLIKWVLQELLLLLTSNSGSSFTVSMNMLFVLQVLLDVYQPNEEESGCFISHTVPLLAQFIALIGVTNSAFNPVAKETVKALVRKLSSLGTVPVSIQQSSCTLLDTFNGGYNPLLKVLDTQRECCYDGDYILASLCEIIYMMGVIGLSISQHVISDTPESHVTTHTVCVKPLFKVIQSHHHLSQISLTACEIVSNLLRTHAIIVEVPRQWCACLLQILGQHSRETSYVICLTRLVGQLLATNASTGSPWKTLNLQQNMLLDILIQQRYPCDTIDAICNLLDLMLDNDATSLDAIGSKLRKVLEDPLLVNTSVNSQAVYRLKQRLIS